MFVNFAAFQLCWFACVLGGANEVPWAGPVLVAGAVAWHLLSAKHRRPEATLVVLVTLLGAVWDSALVALGWLAYPSGTLVAGTAPYWIVALWAALATTLNVSLRWLKPHLVAAAALGAAAGPLAYLAGAKLGGVIFREPSAALLALAIGWSLIMPLLLVLARRCNGFAPAGAVGMERLAAGN